MQGQLWGLKNAICLCQNRLGGFAPFGVQRRKLIRLDVTLAVRWRAKVALGS